MGKPHPVRALTRGSLLRGGATAAGVAVAGSALAAGRPSPANSAAASGADEQTLRYLFELEDLQNAFYDQAQKRGALTGEAAEFAKVVGAHEREHLEYLRKALGSSAPKAGKYDFASRVTSVPNFLSTAVELEETGLAAYTGAAPNLSAATLRDAAKILSVEARHTAWARDILGRNPAPKASDVPASEAQVRAKLSRSKLGKGG